MIFGKRASDLGLSEWERLQALKVLQQQDALLPKSTVLRRVRYFTDGAILGSQDFIRSFIDVWQVNQGRRYPPKTNVMRGANWGGLACIRGLRTSVFN